MEIVVLASLQTKQRGKELTIISINLVIAGVFLPVYTWLLPSFHPRPVEVLSFQKVSAQCVERYITTMERGRGLTQEK